MSSDVPLGTLKHERTKSFWVAWSREVTRSADTLLAELRAAAGADSRYDQALRTLSRDTYVSAGQEINGPNYNCQRRHSACQMMSSGL